MRERGEELPSGTRRARLEESPRRVHSEGNNAFFNTLLVFARMSGTRSARSAPAEQRVGNADRTSVRYAHGSRRWRVAPAQTLSSTAAVSARGRRPRAASCRGRRREDGWRVRPPRCRGRTGRRSSTEPTTTTDSGRTGRPARIDSSASPNGAALRASRRTWPGSARPGPCPSPMNRVVAMLNALLKLSAQSAALTAFRVGVRNRNGLSCGRICPIGPGNERANGDLRERSCEFSGVRREREAPAVQQDGSATHTSAEKPTCGGSAAGGSSEPAHDQHADGDDVRVFDRLRMRR